MDKKELIKDMFLALLVAVFLVIVIDNPFVTWDSCNEQGANAEHFTFGKQCVQRTLHGCSGSEQCEEERATECLENFNSDKWYCNLDEQRRYYK